MHTPQQGVPVTLVAGTVCDCEWFILVLENNCMTTREKALCDASNPCQNDGVCYVVDMNGQQYSNATVHCHLEETPVWKVSTYIYLYYVCVQG